MNLWQVLDSVSSQLISQTKSHISVAPSVAALCSSSCTDTLKMKETDLRSPQAEEYALLFLTHSEWITYSTLSRHHMDFTYAYAIQPGDPISQGCVHA